MIPFSQFIAEDVSIPDLHRLEQWANALFSKLHIDLSLTKHFMDRVNDVRNGVPITLQELVDLFRKEFEVNGEKISHIHKDTAEVLKDLSSHINVPVVFHWDQVTKTLKMKAVTVMRKLNFLAPDPVLAVR
jgi:hypothetical protein